MISVEGDLFVLGGTGEGEFGIKRVNTGALAGSSAVACGYGRKIVKNHSKFCM